MWGLEDESKEEKNVKRECFLVYSCMYMSRVLIWRQIIHLLIYNLATGINLGSYSQLIQSISVYCF